MASTWHKWQLDTMRQMVAKGATNREIGEAVGRSMQAVQGQRERHKLQSGPKGWSLDDVMWARANQETDRQAAYICAWLDNPDRVAVLDMGREKEAAA